MWFLIGFIVGGIIVGFLVRRMLNLEHKRVVDRLWRGWSDDQAFCLKVLCRELSNELIRRDSDRFVALNEKILDEVQEFQKASKTVVLQQLKDMSRVYFSCREFDIINTASFVLYEDAFNRAWLETDVIEKRYRDIRVWCALKAMANDTWDRFGYEAPITSGEVQGIREYVQMFKDTVLLNHIKAAERDYALYQVHGHLCEDGVYKNSEYEVRTLQWDPGIARSFKIRSSGEVGGTTTGFIDDDSHTSYYSLKSADSLDFKDCRMLNDLGISKLR